MRKIVKMLQAKRMGQRGFTLVELLTVAAILATMSAVVFPAVTGTTTDTRESDQAVDLNSVQTAVDRWNSDFGDYPTNADLNGSAWSAGALPTGGAATGTGTSGDPFVFTQTKLAKVKFDDTDTKDSLAVYFNIAYLRSSPRHATDTDLTIDTTGTTYKTKRGSDDIYVKLTASTATKLFGVWSLDYTAKPWVFVNSYSY